MKQFVIVAVLLLAACSASEVIEPSAETTEEVTDAELAGVEEVDDILNELDNLDEELNIDDELAALEEDLQ